MSRHKRKTGEGLHSERKVTVRKPPPVTAQKPVPPPPLEIVPDDPSTFIPLDQLTPHTCRYPFGDGPFMFCGATRLDDAPYCARHSLIAFNPRKY